MEAHRRTRTPEEIAPNGPDSNDDACECARRLLLPRTNAVSFSRRRRYERYRHLSNDQEVPPAIMEVRR